MPRKNSGTRDPKEPREDIKDFRELSENEYKARLAQQAEEYKSKCPPKARAAEKNNEDPREAEHDAAGFTNGGEAQARPRPKPQYDWRKEKTDMKEVHTVRFDPLNFLLPSLIPAEGITLICSKPKVGKSWLLLDLCLSATMNRYVLGELKAVQGDVFYLALEDSLRRLQSRTTKLLPTFTIEWPETLAVTTQWRRVDQGGLQDLREWVEETRGKGRKVAFIAIDVLKMVRPRPQAGKQAYDLDYEAIVGLRQLSLELSVPILIAHHTRKAEAEDLIDKVSGTLGLTAAADAIIVIERQSQGYVFDVRGRDVEAHTLAVEFNKTTCRWTILGDAATVRHSAEREHVLEIFREAAGGPLTVKLVTEQLDEVSQEGLEQSQASPRSQAAVRKILSRMARNGDLIRLKRGEYALPTYPLSQGHKGPKEEGQRPDL
jgi:hypothetical protein